MSQVSLNSELLAKFSSWYQQNQLGGWECLWRRRPVWVSQFMQKLGLHHEVSTRLFWGEEMRVITGETVSRSLLTFGYTETALTVLMLQILSEGQTLVDVGTHFGYEALLGCQLVGQKGHVICFEPNPSAFSLARKNLSRFNQVDLRQEAVSSYVGALKLQNRPIWESAFNSAVLTATGVDQIDVPVTTLDIALANRIQPIDFLKCDVEGLELSVLKGADHILSQDLPVLVLEVDMPSQQGQTSARAYELAEYLEQYNYQAFNFDFDGHFRFGPLGKFCVFHANIAFVHISRQELIQKLLESDV